MVQSFLQICEQERGAIAVHCKAGLGRTGTNIAAYMMKHYGYTAKESTAWCRVCRPGSVVGPQQQFLADIEPRMHQEGNQYRGERSALAAKTESRIQTPPIGKPPVSSTGTLWAGHSQMTSHRNPIPSNENTERRPSTEDGRKSSHRNHAYHEIDSSSRQRNRVESKGEMRRVNSMEASGLAKLKRSEQTRLRSSSDGRTNSRPNTGISSKQKSSSLDYSSSTSKPRSSLNSSPYNSASKSSTTSLVKKPSGN